MHPVLTTAASLDAPRPFAWRASLCAAALSMSMAVRIEAQTFTISGNPGLLRINAAVAGLPPTSVTNASTTYRYNVGNNSPRHFVGQLNQAMPAGVTLTIQLSAPPGATSAGSVLLTTIGKDLVNNVRRTNNYTGSITYTLSATAAAGVVPPQSRIVTITVVAGA